MRSELHKISNRCDTLSEKGIKIMEEFAQVERQLRDQSARLISRDEYVA